MLEITRQSDGTFRSSGKNWEVVFDAPKPGLFTLRPDRSLTFVSRFAVIDNLEEGSALHERRKVHHSNDGREAQFESSCRIPFGAEPGIARKFKLSDGLLSVTTDFLIRASFQVRSLFAGGYRLEGGIARFAVLSAPESGAALPQPEWKSFDSVAEGSVIYDSAQPPVALLAESGEGTVLEIATGEDFWRWTASAPDTVSRYTLTKTENGLEASWLPYEFHPRPEVEVPFGRNRRMNFLLAWRKKGGARTSAQYKDVFDMAAFDWSETLLAYDGAGNPVKSLPCFAAPGVVNVLKKWVRRKLADLQDGDVLAVTNVVPVFCTCAAHQDRARMKSLPHLDVYGINEFRRWANRQLALKGAKLVIVPAKDVKLPSI